MYRVLIGGRGKSKVGVAKICFLESVDQEDSKNGHGVVLFASGVVSFLVSRRGKSKVGVAKIRFLESVDQEDSKNDHGVVLFASGVVGVGTF